MLALDTADQGEDVVLIEGRAELLDDPALLPTLPAYAEKYAPRCWRAWARRPSRWPGSTPRRSG
jgi:hypothetical protein